MSEFDPTMRVNNNVNNAILKARSPIILSMLTQENTSDYTVTIELYIWNGLKSEKPTDPTYTLTITDQSFVIGEVTRFDLASYAGEFIEAEKFPYDEKDACWMDIDISVSYAADQQFNIFTTDFSFIVVDGYATYKNDDKEAEMLHLPSDIYIPEGRSHEITVLDKGIIDTRDIDNLEITYNNNTSENIQLASVPADPSTQDLFLTYSISVPLGATELVLNTRDNTTIVSTHSFIETECTKYDVFQIGYYDKNGAISYVSTIGSNSTTQTAERESYKPNLDMDMNAQYDETKGSEKVLNVNGNETITLNTGFVPEDYKELIRELMMSEYCFLREEEKTTQVSTIYEYLSDEGFELESESCSTGLINGLNGYLGNLDVKENSFEYTSYPLILDTNTIDMTQKLNEKLINYSLDFKRAYATRNNIF